MHGHKVLMGNDMTCQVSGIGSIKFRMWDGSIKALWEVWYVPDLKRNIIPLSFLDAKGLTYNSSGGTLRVFKDKELVIKGTLKHGMRILQGTILTGNVVVSTIEQDEMTTWYRRLGHISLKCLQQLCKEGLIKLVKISWLLSKLHVW